MKIYFLLLNTLLLFSMHIFANHRFVDIDSKNIRHIETIEMRFCYITFIKIDDTTYLVKQKKPVNKLLGVVRDAITAYVAESFDIAHQVDVIPAGKDFPGKIRKDWPATIHTVAPGKTIKKQDSPYNKMNIKQADIGFRRDMLDWMTKHPQLILVIALDTFLCNHDRHRGNLFYDAESKQFCAIDMDSSFKYNLAALACKNFKNMIKSDSLFPLKGKEVRALIEYRNALVFLLDKHHPEDTIEKYDMFAKKAGFVKGSYLYTKKIELELERNRAMIRQSYEDIKDLIIILNDIIKKTVRTAYMCKNCW